MSGYKPTEEQQAILDHFRSHHDNMVIEAGAGTGKTSTLKMLSRVFPNARGVYIAYNRTIADEAAREFPSSVLCKTAHSLAFGAVGRRYAHRLRGPRIPAREAARILGVREPVRLADHLAPLAPQQIARLVMDTITRFCYSADELPENRHVPKVPGLDDKPTHRALCQVIVPLAQKAWVEDLTQANGQLRFSHDIYLKMWQLSRPQLPADYVLLDEAQDANPAVADIVTTQDATQIMVGDRCQSIYGWRGAVDAMATFPGHRFQLSQSFRFGDAVAAEANKWLSLLDSPLRLRGYNAITSTVGPVLRPDAILCRTNAGAMERIMDATAAGRKAALVGGGGEIRRLAEAAIDLRAGRGTDHPDLMAFRTWSEVQEYVLLDSAGADLKVFVELIDKWGPEQVIQVCDCLVDEDDADVVISTAHKAKGREWPLVRIAEDFREPKPDEFGRVVLQRDELMLAYVAVTRARKQLDRGGLAWVDWFGTPQDRPDDPPTTELDELADELVSEPEPLVNTPYGPLPAHEAESLAQYGYVTCRCPVGASRG